MEIKICYKIYGDILTYNSQIDSERDRWVGGHLTLVVARVSFVQIRYAELPIVRVFEQEPVTLVRAVHVVAEREQLHLVTGSPYPRDLQIRQ